MDVLDVLLLSLGTLGGNAIALFLFLAPMKTFERIVSKKSTEKFSGIPYVMTLLYCLLSAWYGLPFISRHNFLATVTYGGGSVMEITYVLAFITYAPRKEKAIILGLFTTVLAVFFVVVFVSLFALHANYRNHFCGFAAIISSVIMYASPLSVMRQVIRTKSVEFMPFFLSLYVFLSGTTWFIYGLLGRNPYVIVPNAIGSALGAMQLTLYFIYRHNKGAPKNQPPTEEESMEMGSTKPHQEKQTNSNGIQNLEAKSNNLMGC